MCYEEFIAYQCGHRSLGVVRPCPMTTAGHNFPICGLPPHKPHYAETMCTPCERQLHSRWVLIREWEHRWLHERGACGCEVIFPGLLTTPRVIGHTSVAESPASSSTTGSAYHITPANDSDATPNLIATTASSKESQGQTEQGGLVDTASSTAAGQIPALFAEGVTSTGEHRVAVRLPGLYAAEWKSDHAALHKSGKCTCAATFTPYKPRVSDAELTAHDRDNLSQWRRREIEGEKNEDARGIEGQAEETIKRIAEIKETFGDFEVGDEEKPPKVKVPRLPPPAAAENQTAKVRGQGQGNNNNNSNNNNPRHFNRRPDNRREKNTPSRPQSQPTRRASASPPTHGQLIVSSPPTNQPLPQAATTALAIPMPTGGGYLYPEYPHHQQQHPQYFVPAHPAYATATTYSDAIPEGAFPWAAAPQATPGMPWVTQGPGPYRTPGLVHTRSDAGAGAQGGQGGQGGYTHPHSHHHPNQVYGYGQGYGQGQSYGHGNSHGYGRGYPNPRSRGERQLAALEAPRPGQGQIQELEAEEDRGRGGWKGVDSYSHQQQQQHHHQQQHQHHQHGANATRPEHLRPVCGLPIGAGPEGTSHMPDWLDCPLRRSASVGATAAAAAGGLVTDTDTDMDTDGGSGGGDGKVGVVEGGKGKEVEVQGEDRRQGLVRVGIMGRARQRQRRGAGRSEGKETDDDESVRFMTPPPLPTRRHSAAT
ncbi:hypothetical protein F5144DRAFT_479425 [Chaetomium tenue]|uniref:Uncharacterized protein n=1 Tax=Chaetomium tenue TaxID=1854479 RepID=A0ACB7PPT3_9PEZI|nr:hypothetical protein F5144DRAFT_479425 [Chaetomium globosum]